MMRNRNVCRHILLALALLLGFPLALASGATQGSKDGDVLIKYFDKYSHCGWPLEKMKVLKAEDKDGLLVALADPSVEFMGNYDFPRGTKLTFKKGVLVKAETDPQGAREIRLYYLRISLGHQVLFSELYGTPTEFTVADQSMLYGHVVEGELKVYWSPNYLEGAQKIEVLKDGSWGGRHLFPNLKKGQVIVFEGGVPKLK